MRNWLEMITCSDREFEYLRNEITQKRCLVYDNIVMPPDCGSEICSIRFLQHSNGAITLYCDPQPSYTGQDQNIRQWCQEGSLTFRNFPAMVRFLRGFSAGASEPAEEPAREAPPMPQRPIPRVDRSQLNPHCDDARTAHGFIAIDAARLEEALSSSIIGQSDAIAKIAHLTATHLGQRRRKRPLSLLLWGTTGVGKSECGKCLPDALNALTDNAYGFHLEVIDCTQLKEEHATARLTGSPPGYVGHDEPCIWDCVNDHPRTVFVFDELEKAHPNVMQVLMEAVDSGRQQASRIGPGGQRFYDLSDCLFLFTSNLDLTQPAPASRIGFRAAPADQAPPATPTGGSTMERIIRDNETARKVLLDKQVYPPEVVGRFTGFIQFSPLSGGDIMELVIQKLSQTAYDQHALCLTQVSPEIVQAVYNLCAPQVPSAGVRVIQRVIDTYLGEALMRCSHRNPEYARVALEGTLDAPVLLGAEPDPLPIPPGNQPEYS